MPRQEIVGTHANGRERWRLEDGQMLMGVRPYEHDCIEFGCVIHNPRDHHMRGWRFSLTGPGGLMLRECPHGFEHPDPDSIAYFKRTKNTTWVHPCDGCCYNG